MTILFRLLKRNQYLVILSFVTAVIANASQMLYLFFIGELVNRIEDRSIIEISFLLLLGAFLISNALTQYLYQLTCRYTSERAAHTLRMGFIRQLLEKSVQDGEADSVAGAMSIVQNELSAANDYLSNTFFDMAGMLMTGVFVFLFLMLQNVKLTMVILLPTVLTLVYVHLSGRKLSEIVEKTLEEKNQMNRVAYSAIDNFQMVTLFDAGRFLLQRYDQHLDEWGSFVQKEDRLYAVFNSLSGVLSRLPLLLLLLVGGYMVLKGEILLGTLIVFLNLQKSLTQIIMNLPIWLARFRTFTVNLSRIDIF